MKSIIYFIFGIMAWQCFFVVHMIKNAQRVEEVCQNSDVFTMRGVDYKCEVMEYLK